ncbi:MAG TPA: hypothetical protein VIU29_05155, partial [Candidatus Deferrimicrobiaceae bacterium]
GILAEPGDLAALSAGVARVLRDGGGLRPGFKRDRLIREFDQSEMVRAQERLYLELLHAKGIA